MKVGELMVKDVITCGDTAKLGEIAGMMWEHDIGFIPVISSENCLLYTSPSPRDRQKSRMPSSA